MKKSTTVFSIFLDECGIEAQYTISDTPQHNEIVDRRNCILIDMVRCKPNHSMLPYFHWGGALKTNVYILNQVSRKYV